MSMLTSHITQCFFCQTNTLGSFHDFLGFSYDNDETTRDEIKERFALTMDFVENYLRDVVCQNVPFSDKEKNKLTFEVSYLSS